ncbi:hypothetical protein C0J52_06257 [Blattella germanica]|nr:hypothetical protein C0J52_06257 [Blattella germanica]
MMMFRSDNCLISSENEEEIAKGEDVSALNDIGQRVKRARIAGQDNPDSNENKELRRLQFYGAGPKMAGYHARKEEKPKNKTRGKKVNYEFDPVSGDDL